MTRKSLSINFRICRSKIRNELIEKQDYKTGRDNHLLVILHDGPFHPIADECINILFDRFFYFIVLKIWSIKIFLGSGH